MRVGIANLRLTASTRVLQRGAEMSNGIRGHRHG